MAKTETPPHSGPQVTPNPADMPLYSNQILFEMNHTLGSMDAKIDRLITDVAAHMKIDSLRMKMAYFAGGGAVIGFLIALALKFLPLH